MKSANEPLSLNKSTPTINGKNRNPFLFFSWFWEYFLAATECKWECTTYWICKPNHELDSTKRTTGPTDQLSEFKWCLSNAVRAYHEATLNILQFNSSSPFKPFICAGRNHSTCLKKTQRVIQFLHMEISWTSLTIWMGQTQVMSRTWPSGMNMQAQAQDLPLLLLQAKIPCHS